MISYLEIENSFFSLSSVLFAAIPKLHENSSINFSNHIVREGMS